jgi:hypothetical protein
MKTPAQYHFELSELKAAKAKGLDATGQSDLMDKLTRIENQLTLDIHSLGVQFRGRAVSQLGNTNLKAGKGKKTAEKRLQEDQTSRLKPYQGILDQVKEMIQTMS